MRLVPLLALALALNAGAENLLKNPSFEVVSDGSPAAWSVFVQPKQGASSFYDQRVAKDGSASVKLSIDSPYIEDPANNWSQNVLADVRGKRLHLNGMVKTENATEAAVWVQCYSRNPLRLVLQESTASSGLLTGTHDWTPVELSLVAPIDTDFVVVRCVLRFRGTAWFDALSLEAETAQIKSPAAPAAKMPTPPSMPAVPETIPAPPATSTVRPAPSDEIMRAHEELRKANWQLRQSNAAMTEQLEELRGQIDDLKRQIGETAAAAKQLQEGQPKRVERETPVVVPPPPLVPNEDAP
ncbi:MAG: hypothetical protein HUU46_13150 [Candidatus Hydrogenedentes bacterium]|nr:hypothetical protein [Candidatus Hydrogenedentota bacterium]